MMRSSQLATVLQKGLPNDYVTVCPVNKLVLDNNGIYVVNTDNDKGRHWTLIFVTDTTVEFFDSFGRDPKFIQNGSMFMNSIYKTNKTLVVTSKLLQHRSSYVCGWYCLAYAYIRVKTNSVQMFYDMFTMNLLRNDQFVVFLVKTLLLL